MAKKDYIPLWIAISSGVFSLLSTIADNLTKAIPAPIQVQSVRQSELAIKGFETVKSTRAIPYTFNLVDFALKYPKPIIFGSVSLIAITVFCIIKFKRHRINRRRK